MLESLHVKNLALIDEQEVNFDGGMNILTGETGAGKSILIGSINLALGARADKDYIREGAEYALVELSFSLNEQQCALVREMELPLEDDGTLLLKRKIMPGKSTCRVGGESISAAQLKKLAPCLLDLYGQHEHQSLLKPAAYKKMLDDYIGDAAKEQKALLKSRIAEYRKTVEEMEAQKTDEKERAGKMRLLEFEAAEIDGAGVFTKFFKVALPSSTPILATVAIWAAVGQWNSFQDTLIYITDQKLYSLQYLLYTYLNQASSLATLVKSSGSVQAVANLATQQTPTSIRMTISVIVVLPILFIYPMFQKHFVKGMMIGAVKG